MTKSKLKLRLGDSVVVKPNVEDPDMHIIIGGWQGRVTEIDEKENLICIDWDSRTLKQMPAETIEESEEEGLDWTKMYLAVKDVEQTTARDNEDDVEEAVRFLARKYQWSSLGRDGRRIQAVLDNAEDESEEAAFAAWQEHFQKVLHFPFEAEVFELQEKGALRAGDKVTVTGIEESEDIYGILASLRHGSRKYVFPLCDLEVHEKSSANYQPAKDYAIWFANR